MNLAKQIQVMFDETANGAYYLTVISSEETKAVEVELYDQKDCLIRTYDFRSTSSDDTRIVDAEIAQKTNSFKVKRVK